MPYLLVREGLHIHYDIRRADTRALILNEHARCWDFERGGRAVPARKNTLPRAKNETAVVMKTGSDPIC